MPTPPKLLIVIADGEHARFVRRTTATGFRTERRFDSIAAHRKSSDLRSDRPGASFHTGSTAHHAVTPRHDPHEMEKEVFASALAEELNDLPADTFEQLILVAPPATLDIIRSRLAPGVRPRVIATLAKDLVKIPEADLWSHLHGVIPPGAAPHGD